MNFYDNAVIFDRFQIVEKREEGLIFTSFLGKNLDTGEKVLIVLLNPDKYTHYDVDKICFNAEVPFIKEFEHKNIMRVIEAGLYSNTVCIVSEYIAVTPLRLFLSNRGALDVSTSLNLITQLASALRYAHSKNIIHRNLTADCIGLCEKDGEFLLKLMGFGVSYIIDNSSTPSAYIDEEFGFMAPEATGLLDRKVDSRSDLYSLGILLYRLITGSYPFHADSIDNMVYQHVAVMPKEPTELNPAIPAAVSKIAIKLLMKDPDQRYQSANELINDIDLFLASNTADLHVKDEDLLQTMYRRSKLFSRKYELSQLRNYYTKALEGPGRFCLVKGSLGCGKSDLFSNLSSELDLSSIPYFRAHFSAQTTMTPYSAFHDILDDFTARFSQYDRKLQMTERNRLARSLMGLSDLVFKICPDMKRVLPESLALPTLDGFREQRRSAMLLANFFMSLVNDKPYVIILDDIHFADTASLLLLCEMADNIKDHKIFIVCSCRSQDCSENSNLNAFLELFRKEKLFTQLELQPFSEDRMCEYLSDLLILDKDECQVLSKYITDKTGGNPYFAVNIVRSMLEDNVISVANGILEQNWEQLRIVNQPSDVMQLISRRMDKLSEDTLTLLEIASVIGDSFKLNLLSLITDLDSNQLLSYINEAAAMQFIQYSSSTDIMEFSHRDIHSAFFERVEPARRKCLHYWIAKAIEALAKDIHHEIYSLVFHFTEAGSDADLKKYLLEAASLARYSYATNEALTYFSKAVSLIEAEGGKGSEDWQIAVTSLIDLNLATGNCDYALRAANELLPMMTDDLEKAKLSHRIGLAYYRISNFEGCEEYYLKALNYLGEKFNINGPALKIRTYRLRTRFNFTKKLTLNLKDNPEQNETYIDHKAKLISSIYESLCWIYAFSNIDKFNYSALRMYNYNFHRNKNSNEFGASLSAISIYHMFKNSENACDQSAMLAFKLRSQYGNEYGKAECNLLSGICYQSRSELERSIKFFKEAAEGFKSIGDLWQYNSTNIYLCHSYRMAGAYKTCMALCEECISSSIRLSDSFSLALAYTHLMSCYCETGNYANAEEVAKRCRPVIDKLNFPYATLDFYNEYGRLLIEIGKYSDAIDLLSKAQVLLDSNKMPSRFTVNIYSNLAIAMCRYLDKERLSLTLNEIQNQEFKIATISDVALAISKKYSSYQVIAYRSQALLSIMTEHYKKTEVTYTMAINASASSQYHYENALLNYEYGRYLLSKHKSNEARFYIFEAYMIFSHIGASTHMKDCESIISEKYQEAFSESPLMTDITARRNRMSIDRKVNTLLQLGERLTSTLELEELQRKILQDAVELVGAERGILFLYPEIGDKKLYVASVYNLGNFDCNTYDWMLEEVEKNRKPIIINDVQSDEYRRHYSVIARYGIKSVMAMPMFVRGVLFGVIYLDSRLVRQIFTDDYVEAMGFIANQAGAPIENARLYHRAITDGLTGVYGRSYLDNLIIDRTGNIDAKLSAIMIDVDNFKHCNDTYGHPFGDKVLKQIAGIMKRVSGEHGVPCRYGGEEFVVLLDSNDSKFVMDIAEKIRQTVEKSTLACNNGTEVALVSVTISLGVSIWNYSMERVDLIEHADKALYYAKTHGKNQAVLWNEDI